MDASHLPSDVLGRGLNPAHAVTAVPPAEPGGAGGGQGDPLFWHCHGHPGGGSAGRRHRPKRRRLKLAAILLYIAGLAAMLGCSAAYNLVREHWCRPMLRRCDHAAIFAMIAGSYTPFTLLTLNGGWSVGLTAIIWTLALVGMALKLWAPPRGMRALSVAPYLLLGWIGLSAIFPLLTALGPQTFALIVLGGLFYSVGVVFHMWDSLRFQNAIWHGFVLAGAATHYLAILHGAAPKGLTG